MAVNIMCVYISHRGVVSLAFTWIVNQTNYTNVNNIMCKWTEFTREILYRYSNLYAGPSTYYYHYNCSACWARRPLRFKVTNSFFFFIPIKRLLVVRWLFLCALQLEGTVTNCITCSGNK